MVTVYGHRGVSSLAPENTMAAFALVSEHKIPGVELDVYQCASGEIVVAHDNNLQRTAGVDLQIESASLSQISEHDVGSWFGPEFADQRIPLLSDVFDLLGSSVLYDIEIKPHGKPDNGQGVEATTVELIRERGLQDRTIISSFDPFVARRGRIAARRLGIDLPVAVIYANHPDMPWFLRKGQGRLIAGASVMKPQFSDATLRQVRFHQRRGRQVFAWTVDKVSDAKRMVEMGADALISNRPQELLAALG